MIAPPDNGLSDGWKHVRFGDVVRQSKAKVDPEADGIERYVAGEHMDTDDLRIRQWGEVGDGYLGPAFHRYFSPGQVLYGSRRTYLRKVAVADFEGVCANTTFVVESGSPDLQNEFLPYVMTSESFHAYSISRSKGSTNPYINFSDLAAYEFALPPLDEQQRIVELLGAVDAVRDGYRTAIQQFNVFLDAVRMSRGISVIENVRLGDLAASGGIQVGPFGSQLHADEYREDGVAVVMPTDLRDGQFSRENLRFISEETAAKLQVHELRSGDILLPRRGELNKRALVTADESGWLCGTGCVRVRLEEPELAPLVTEILASSASVKWLEANAVGTTMPNLNSEIVSRIPIPLPTVSERPAWTARLHGARHTASSLVKSAEQAGQLRRELLRSLLGPSLHGSGGHSDR